jgi:hypothetical protein
MGIINGDFTFHPVGQGLFYSGRISCNNNNLQTNFVYDCGINNYNKHFENIVKKYAGSLPGKSLDMLVLSHFHEDHINGLKLLFDEGITIKKCFIPYFTPEERFIIWASVWNELGDEEWYFNFLMDPITYLINNNVEQVIIIGKGSGDSGENEDPAPPESPDNFDNYKEKDKANADSTVNIDKLVKDDELQRSILNNFKQWEDFVKNEKLFIRSHKGYITISCAWYFRFFNLKDNLSNEIQVFKDSLKKDGIDFLKLQNEPLYMKEKQKEVKKCYRNAFKGKDGINMTSLTVYHSPIDEHMHHFYALLGNCYCPGCFMFYGKRHTHNHFYNYCITGQLLTGDINLNNIDNLDEFLKHYQKVLNNVFLFQLPHHGSEHNWNKKLLNVLSFCNIWVASAGLHNSYNHPSDKVFNDIEDRNRIPMLIFEYNKFNYGFKIRRIR